MIFGLPLVGKDAWIGLDLLASVQRFMTYNLVVSFSLPVVSVSSLRVSPPLPCVFSSHQCLWLGFHVQKSALRAFRFMICLGRFFFLISCLSDALGLWGGLRPCSGVPFRPFHLCVCVDCIFLMAEIGPDKKHPNLLASCFGVLSRP